MAFLKLITCGSGGGNLGLPSCVHTPKFITAAVAIPKGYVYTATTLLDFRTTLQAQLVNDTYASRAFIINGFEEIDDQSEGRQQKTWAGTGNKTTTRRSTYDWVFYYENGAMCRHQSLLQFNNRQNEFDYLFFDTDWNIIGTDRLDSNGVPGFGGVSLTEFFVDNWKAATGSDPAMFMCNFKINDTKQLNENYAYAKLDFDITALSQIQDVILQPIGSTNKYDATGAINIAIYAGCGGQNLVTLYGSSIANIARFIFKNTATGATITQTGLTVAGSGDGQYLAVNLDATTNYPTAGGYITADLVAVSTIFTALGGYYDAKPLILQTL